MRRGARTVIIQASISANTGTGDIVFMIPAARAPERHQQHVAPVRHRHGAPGSSAGSTPRQT